MSSVEEIKKRLRSNWYKFINSNSNKFATNVINGSSPPSIFVGEYGYPHVRVGPMIPPFHGETSVLDKPELWMGKSLEEIINYRINLLKGTKIHSVNEISGRYIEALQDMSLAKNVVDSTVTFEKCPRFTSKINFNSDETVAVPSLFSAPLADFKIAHSTANRNIEKKYYDQDLHSSDAIIELYDDNIDLSQISKVLSMGMLGRKKNRRLVPTKWSITAIDDILSSHLLSNIQDNPLLDSYLVFDYCHLDNYYSIILIPDEVWSFEMIESWIDTNGRVHIGSDYELGKKIDHYPSIAGAYFAARMAVTEYLFKVRKRSSVLIFREIHPEYFLSLGVWQVREGIRQCLREKEKSFESFDTALSYGVSKTSLSKKEWIRNSSVIKNRAQRRMSDYLE